MPAFRGIDSPVAAYLMMKRGCSVDYIHFYNLSDGERVLGSKVIELVDIVNSYQGSSKVYLVPFRPFQIAILNQRIDLQYELVIFRRFMARVAERLAGRRGYKAIVTGDSLGQVASQTLENLCALDEALSLPVFRPLISYDKQEIIDISKRIGTYEKSLMPYKDCCSLLTSRPTTKTDLKLARALEKRIDVDDILETSLGLMNEIIR